MRLSKPQRRSWLVDVQQQIRLPHRERDDTIERTFAVYTNTAKQAESAIKRTGIKGKIVRIAQQKHEYTLAETLADAKARPMGNEPRRKRRV